MKTLIGFALIACLIAAVACGGQPATPTAEPAATPIIGQDATATLTPSPPVAPGPPTLSAVEGTPTPTVPGIPAQPPAQPQARPVSIAMASTTTGVGPGQEFSVGLNLEPQGRGISGVELEIRFDPAIFQMVDVVPGDLLGEKPEEVRSIIPIIDIDNESGTLRYADVRADVTRPPTPAGLFATVRFRVLETAVAGREASLKITGVKIADENIVAIGDVLVGGELKVEISP